MSIITDLQECEALMKYDSIIVIDTKENLNRKECNDEHKAIFM